MLFRMHKLLRGIPVPGAARRPLGVDIGSRAVKLLRWPGRAGSAPDYAIEPLPTGAVVDSVIRDPKAVGRRIAKAAARLRARGGCAISAVPAAKVMRRTLALEPEMSDAEVEAQILVEADRYIPHSIDEVRFDFKRLPAPDSAGGTHLLSVCRKELVDSRARAVECAGLRAAAVDAEHHAIERAWRLLADKPDSQALVAIADLGAGAVRLHVLANGRSVYNAEQAAAGQAQAWRTSGSFPAAMAEQIAQALQLFHSSSRHGRVRSLHLCGGMACADGAAERTGDLLALPVSAANPFAAAFNARLGSVAPSLLLAAGLAMAEGSMGDFGHD